MKGRKGFTLIELLAIIVILAIIAVITVPLILGIIDDAKKGVAENSAYGYKEAINRFYASELMRGSDYSLDDKIYTISELETAGVSISGAAPDSNSWVNIVDNELVSACLQFGDYKVTISDGVVGHAVKGECDEYIEFNGTYVAPLETDTHLGVVYLDPTRIANVCNAELADANRNQAGYKNGISTGCMKWYIFSENEDNTVNMILDHNISDNARWACSSSSLNDPPYNALQSLKSITDDWDLPYINSPYINQYYTIDYSTYKARLISKEEVSSIINKYYVTSSQNNFFDTNSSTEQSSLGLGNSRYGWLFSNLRSCANYGCWEEGEYTTNGMQKGYWTSTSYTYNNDKYNAWFVDYSARIYTETKCSTGIGSTGLGIRPVIQLSKAIFEQ